MKGKTSKMAVVISLCAIVVTAVIVAGFVGYGPKTQAITNNNYGSGQNSNNQNSSGTSGSCILPSAPSITIKTPSIYSGAEQSAKVVYRLAGTSTWTSTTGGSTISSDPGASIEYVAGLNTTINLDQPFGEHGFYTVPCASNPVLQIPVAPYTNGSSVSFTATNPKTNALITASATLNVTNGDQLTVPFTLQGTYQHDFGNRYTSASNVFVLKYKTADFTSIKMTDNNGNEYAKTGTPVIDTSAASGYTLVSYLLPVLQSNVKVNGNFIVDATGSGKNPSGNNANVTWNMYDNTWFINSNTYPPAIQSDVVDQSGNNIGSSNTASGTVYLAPN
jgi:hypothetical protein